MPVRLCGCRTLGASLGGARRERARLSCGRGRCSFARCVWPLLPLKVFIGAAKVTEPQRVNAGIGRNRSFRFGGI